MIGLVPDIFILRQGYDRVGDLRVSDGRAIDFYRKCGFTRAGKTEPMWIYAGQDH
jgi:ribosomal protein S18 acetylase RimI-like enzyme